MRDPPLSAAKLQEQIEVRRTLLTQLVGSLYTSILLGELEKLKAMLTARSS